MNNLKLRNTRNHPFPLRSEYLLDEWWEEFFLDLDGYPSRRLLQDAVNGLEKYKRRISS